MRLSVAEIATIADGRLVGAADDDVVVDRWVFDSRSGAQGACFVALSGTRDGHEFVADAFAAGAVAALVAAPTATPSDRGGVQIVVDDPLRALGRLGAAARDRLDATVVGITGSVGKTATKNLTAAAIGGARRTHASPASYNNESGVPLTLLSAPDDVEVLVCEMATRAAGDITYLTGLARPSVGAITSIELAHAGPLGGLAGVLGAKGELVEALPASGTAVLNADVPDVHLLAKRTSAAVLDVGTETTGAQIVYRGVRLDDTLAPTFELVTPWGHEEIRLTVSGAHQASNAAMAAGIALSVGVDLSVVASGLSDARPVPGRMDLHHLATGITLIDDAYNANPASTAAGLRALAALDAGRRIAVLGHMVELGEHSEESHVGIGRLARELGIDLVVVVGADAAPIAEGVGTGSAVERVEDPAAAAAFVAASARSGDAILVKASRSVGLDRTVDELVRELG